MTAVQLAIDAVGAAADAAGVALCENDETIGGGVLRDDGVAAGMDGFCH